MVTGNGDIRFRSCEASEVSGQNRIIQPVLLIALLNSIIFAIKVHGQFLADDFITLVAVKRFQFSYPGLIDVGTFGAFFRPVLPLIWAFLYRVVGSHPLYYHFLELGFHVINAVLVYLLFRNVLQEKIAFISACIFSAYAGQLEAVMSTHFSFDIVVLAFYLTSLLLLNAFLTARRYSLLAVSLVAAMLSILSKENAITLPAIVFLFTLVRPGRKRLRNLNIIFSSILLSLPYFLLYFLYIIFRQHYGLQPASLVALLNPKLLLSYTDVLYAYVFPFARAGNSPLVPFAVGAFSIALLLCVLCVKETRRGIIFGLVWVAITAIPTLSLLPTGTRFFYMPSVGFSLVLGQMMALPSAFLPARRLSSGLTCFMILVYSITGISHDHNWTAVWSASEKVRESFRDDVVSLLKKPARVYFFGVPRTEHGIICFAVGLTQCFTLMKEENGLAYYEGQQGIRVHIQFPEKDMREQELSNYYFFEWDSSNERFRQFGRVLRDSRPFVPGENTLFSWNFSKVLDFSQWEASNDLMLTYDKANRRKQFITTGGSSFLKSPSINQDIKCVVIRCRVKNPEDKPLSAQLFWVTSGDLEYNGDKSVIFPVRNDGVMHTYSLPLYVNAWSIRQSIHRLALRVGDRPGTLIEMESVTIYGY